MRGLRSIVLAIALSACGSNADSLGVGAQCGSDADCTTTTPPEHCLTNFKGGYCGLQGCVHDTDCPTDSACIMHTDGHNYCFRLCADKTDCNANRDPVNEANCESSITFVDGTMNRKACVPPS
jgi:hypothetical protein